MIDSGMGRVDVTRCHYGFRPLGAPAGVTVTCHGAVLMTDYPDPLCGGALI